MKISKVIVLALMALFMLDIASAVTINFVSVTKVGPGDEGLITVELENTFSDVIEDVTFTLKFDDLPFIPVGSSSGFVEEIDENDEETFVFRFRANSDIAAGSYQIPYEINYVRDDKEATRFGSIGVLVSSQPELSFSASMDKPVIDEQGTLTLRIVNRGFADAKFVNVKLYPLGFGLLSEEEVYVGTVDSDDFETATFDVVFTSTSPVFSAIVEYRDFDNNLVTSSVSLPLKIYSRDEAIALGLISRSNTLLYIGIAVAIILIWFIWRYISKRRRMKRSMQR